MPSYLDSCKSCWWQEGGMCYLPGVERVKGADGLSYSTKVADAKCEKYEGKRAVLSRVFPPGMLTIVSEENAKARGEDTDDTD